MQVYTVGSRGRSLYLGALALLVGAPFVITSSLWLFGLMVVNGKSQATAAGDVFLAVAFILAGLLSVRFAWQYLTEYPYEVRLGDERIEFLKAIGKCVVARRDIRHVERAILAIGLEGQDARVFRLSWHGGAIRVPYGEGSEQLVADLMAENPSISAVGSWPEQSS